MKVNEICEYICTILGCDDEKSEIQNVLSRTKGPKKPVGNSLEEKYSM